MVRLGAADEVDAPASGRYEMRAGERFLVQTAAGGYGDARLCECAAIDRDVAEGYVSASIRETAATKDRA